MKRMFILLAIAAGVVALTGQAFSQVYDASSYGYGGQSQQYGSYGQPQQGYGQAQQYGASGGQQQYGAYGQQNGAYGYGQQGQAGYYGYQDYTAGQYQGYQNYGAAPVSRRGASNPANYSYGPARARQSAAMPQSVAYPSGTVGETSRVVPVPKSKLEREEIYWDGRYTVEDEDGVGVQAAPSRPVQPARPVVRTPRAATRATVTRNGRAVARPNVVTRQTRRTPAPPAAREELKWGKQEKPVSQRSFAWGKQEKPAIVGAEPGSLQGARTEMQPVSRPRVEEAAPVASADPGTSSRKFQWGKSR